MIPLPAAELKIVGVSIWAVAPEIILSAGGMLLLVIGSGLKRGAQYLLLTLSLLILGGGAAAAMLSTAHVRPSAFAGTVALDGFAIFFKLVLIGGAMLSVLAAHHFLHYERAPATEFFGLVMFATVGMMLMASATDLILLFVALETFSLALYVMAAFRRSRLDSQESALKYFLTGSFSSAFFLYGTALAYGAVGSTRLSAISSAISKGQGSSGLLLAALALLLIGLAFKIGAVPFHMWTPDAYQGAPSPAVGFMAAGSKAAGFAALLRLLIATFPQTGIDWKPVVMVLSVASMLLGSVVAVAQTNIKRMLAYSAIAHSGFLLLGVIASNDRGVSGSLFYLAVYTFTIVGAFAVVYAVGRPGEPRIGLDDFKGLWSRQPFLAITFALLLVSLAGIPPTGGFWAKFEVFSAAAASGDYALVVVGVLSSAVAAFFYLRIIVLMFLSDESDWGTELEPSPAPGAGFALIVACAVVLVLGVLPSPLLDLAREAVLLPR